MGYLQTLAKALTDDGLVLPSPVRSFLKGKPQPLALDTRERLAEWCAAHGYSDEQRQSLHKLIRTIVARDNYLRAVASGSSRIDLDGVETGPVSDIERESAAKSLAAIAAKRMKPEPRPWRRRNRCRSRPCQATPSRRWRPPSTPRSPHRADPPRARRWLKSGSGVSYRAMPSTVDQPVKAIGRRQHHPAAPHGAAVARLRGPPGSGAREHQAQCAAHDRHPSQGGQPRRYRRRAIGLGGRGKRRACRQPETTVPGPRSRSSLWST